MARQRQERHQADFGSAKRKATRRMIMDFIERIFGISPDGGSGSFELMLIVVPILCVLLLYWYRSTQKPSR
jgi:hypothetical protein